MNTILDELLEENDHDLLTDKALGFKDTEILFDPTEKKLGLKKDRRRRISRTKKSPFRYICNFEYGGTPCCASGTLVGPRTVLTTGHNVWDRIRDRVINLKAVPIRIVPGRNGSSKPLPTSSVNNIVVFPGFSSSQFATKKDIAILHLDNPIGNSIGYWSLDHKTWPKDPRGVSISKGILPFHPGSGKLKVNLSGYPGDKPSGCGTPTCGTQQWWTYNKAVLKEDGILHYFNDTKVGHSGSPVWIKRSKWKGGRVLVAVHVSKDAGGDNIKANRGVFIDHDVRSFIKTNLI